MRYIISDLHLGHANIIEYAHRPYETIDEMNEALVTNWNETVTDDDTVLLLGDIRHHPSKLTAEEWIDKLNGNILLVRGNHDGGIGQNSPIQIVESCTISHGRYRFYCEHRPADETSFWQLHGHTHQHRPFIDIQRKNVNVSVEKIDYTPLLMDELIHFLEQREKYFNISHAREQTEIDFNESN